MKHLSVALLGLAVVVVAACSGSAEAPTLTAAEARAQVAAFTISPGESAMNSLEIDGTTLAFALFVPPGFTPQTTAPVLLALPPGPQSAANVDETMDGIYVSEASRRGWVVVSPIAPDGVRFFDGSESLIPTLMEQITRFVLPEGGRVHLAGMSNGGISAFRIAAEHPDDYASITVFPGFPRSGDDRDALADLTGIPIVMFAGETDTTWVDAANETVVQIRDVGGNVRLEVLPGEGHVPQSLWQGDALWDTFASARLGAG